MSCPVNRNTIRNGLTSLAADMVESSQMFAKVRKSVTLRDNGEGDDAMFFQLEAGNRQRAIEALDKYLIDYLKPFHVKTKEFDELKSRLGIDAVGATDIINKLIWLRKNRYADTVPEEFGHMITHLLGRDQPEIKELLLQVKSWYGYQEVYDQYMPIYNNEDQVKIEAVGKLIAAALVKNHELAKKDPGFFARARKAIDAFFKIFTGGAGIFEEMLEYPSRIADKLAIRILSGEELIDMNVAEGLSRVNYDETVNASPFAKSLIEKFTTGKYARFTTTGSLAISKQGSMFRPIKEKIHDIDFVADGNDEQLEEFLEDMDAMGGVAIHGGIAGDDYVTYSFVIPKPGHKITDINRWPNGYMYNYMVDGRTPNEDEAYSTDFFWSPESRVRKFEDVSAFEDVFLGKMFLSPLKSKARIFERAKDLRDFQLFKPSMLGQSLPQFVYFQLEEETEYEATQPGAQGVVNDINEKFNDKIIQHRNGLYQIKPSEKLVDKYERAANKIDTLYSEYRERLTGYDEEELKASLGLATDATAQDFIDAKLKDEKPQIAKFRQANPDFKIVFSEEDSQFDPASNTVFISLPELYDTSLREDLPFEVVVRSIMMHEMAHAASYYAFETNKNDTVVKGLFDKVKAEHAKNPFVDKLRQGNGGKKSPYAFNNIHEFIADSFGNPYFQEYLKTIPHDAERSMFDAILDAIWKFFGLDRRPTMYDAITDYINSRKIQRDNQYAANNPDIDWNMAISVRAQAKGHTQVAFDLMTQQNVKAEVDEIINKIPDAIKKLQKALNYETDKKKVEQLSKLIKSFQEVKGNSNSVTVSINMLMVAAEIAQEIEKELLALEKLTDPVKRVTLAYSLLNQAQALEFIQPLSSDIRQLVIKQGETAGILPFTRALKSIDSTVLSAKRTFTKITQKDILEQLVSFVGESEAEKRLNAEIAAYDAELVKAKANERPLIEGRRKNAIARRKLIPNRDNIRAILEGKYEDASSSQLLFEAAMMNNHPLVNTVMKILRQNNMNVTSAMLSIGNEHQRQLDALKKAVDKGNIRKTDDYYEPITTIVERADGVLKDIANGEPILDEQGNLRFTYTPQRMLLSSYSPEYLKKSSELTATIRHFEEKRKENADNEPEAERFHELVIKAERARKDFYRENSEGRYTEEVLAMYDILDREIMKDGKPTTFGRERGYLFEELEEAEMRRNTVTTEDQIDRAQEDIDRIYIQIRQLKSPYNTDGSPKTGFEKELADIATEYSTERAKYGEYVLTPEGQAAWEKEVAALEDALANKRLTLKTFDAKYAEITATELKEDYWVMMKLLTKQMVDISEQLAKIPEFSKVFVNVDKDKIREGYERIKSHVNPFRDNEFTIDGQLFSSTLPDLVPQIKAIQEEIEKMHQAADTLRGLSKAEQRRLDELYDMQKSAALQDWDMDEMNELTAKREAAKLLSEQHKDLLDAYNSIRKAIGEMNESKNSSYYLDEVDNQNSIVHKSLVEKYSLQAKTLTSMEGGKFLKVKNRWVEVSTETDGTTVHTPVDIGAFSTMEEALGHKLANKYLKTELEKTDWFKDNHFKRWVFQSDGKGGGEMVEIDQPIYIWVKTEPKDKTYITPNQPSIRFKTYKVYDGTNDNPDYTNPNFGMLNDRIPIPKKGKFTDARYEKLVDSKNPVDKAYFNFLEFQRQEYRKAQEFAPAHKRLADILPSLAKTNDERSVERVESLKSISVKLMAENLRAEFGKSSSDDEAVSTDGSMSNEFAKMRVLPIRFAGKMDVKDQSADIPAMVLAFTQSTIEYTEMSKDQPLLEAIRTQVEGLSVEQTKNVAGKLSVANIIAAIRTGKREQLTNTKDTDETNLLKSINHVLDTYLYQHTKEDANVVIAGSDVDMNKVSSNLKKFSSMSIFAFNTFSAVKNTVSAAVQGQINANIGQGFYTLRQYQNAHLEAVGHTKDFLQDYRKFGNKTKIGQELDLFQVMQGSTYNAYGQKTAWTVVKSGADAITMFKGASEFELQVAQYLAMSKANPVEVDGKMVEWRKAFMIDDKGNLVPKPGAVIDTAKIEAFTHRLAYINRAVNGAYRQEEKNKLQKNILGDLAFYLNGYLIPGIVNRFGRTRYSAEADMITRGYHNQMFSFIGDLYRYRNNMFKVWPSLNAEERARCIRSWTELGVIMGFVLLAFLMGAEDDKEELEKNSGMYNMALALLIGVKSETETFMPLPGMGLNEIARKMNSPFAAMRQITNIIKVLNNLWLWTIGHEDALYKQDTAAHDKGDPKFVANFLRLVGYTGTAFDPLEKAMQMDKAQELR